MRPSILLGSLLVFSTSAAAINENFQQERPKLAKVFKGKGGNPQPKYFKESTFSGHYDGRYAEVALPVEEQNSHLSYLIQTYLATMDDLGVETWLMHGTLLAWWWNQKIFPWDDDLDVQVSEPGIHFLAQNYNMSQHHFDIPGTENGRSYVLEVNPHYVVRSTADTRNVIDARWIDTSSGLFIDITAVRADDFQRGRGIVGALQSKDKHRYNENDIFPLRRSIFEGVPARVPYDYTKLLIDEYHEKSMTNSRFQGWTFLEETQTWVKSTDVKNVLNEFQQHAKDNSKDSG